jgi:hypothetical protein
VHQNGGVTQLPPVALFEFARVFPRDGGAVDSARCDVAWRAWNAAAGFAGRDCLHGGGQAAGIALAAAYARAFCELLAPLTDLESAASDLFLMGLLSAIDAILDRKMEDVLKEIPIRSEIRAALLAEENALRGIYDLALHYERPEWPQFQNAAGRLGIPQEATSDLYVRSMHWAAAVLAGEEVADSTPA